MTIKFTLLGCGSSMGVPRPDGFFGNCDPKIKKNYRTRCSALIKTSEENILIRSGHLCNQGLMNFLNIDGCLRASLSFYNSIEEVDIFIDRLKWAMKFLKR